MMRPHQPPVAAGFDPVAPAVSLPALALALVLALVAVLTAGGCNEQRHYELLKIFFDGVPSPYEKEQEDETRTVVGPDGRPRTVAVAYYYHQPYTDRQCEGCHDIRLGYELASADANLCGSCHASHVEPAAHDWVHGAVVFGECSRCHEPHRAEHPGLLKSPQPQVCFDCHDRADLERSAYHRELDDLTCSRCHDPHAAGNRLLLADSRTYARRKVSTIASEHTNWTREDCALCHQRDLGNIVVDDVDQVCLSCHGDVLDTPRGRPLHEAVKTGHCTTCHEPHHSVRPALIRPTAEKICTDCHDPQKLPRPQHPVVVRGDCLMCHRGHSAERPSLLRPNITTRTSRSPPGEAAMQGPDHATTGPPGEVGAGQGWARGGSERADGREGVGP